MNSVDWVIEMPFMIKQLGMSIIVFKYSKPLALNKIGMECPTFQVGEKFDPKKKKKWEEIRIQF